MSNFLNSYPIFENNQVLTSSQLNDLVAYLDEQNRLTRAKLIGTGIVCGFDLKFNNSVTPYELTIFQGMGITSEGYLITEGDCVVKRYKPYNLPAGVRYIPFEDPETTIQDVVLWELLTDDATTLPTDVIEPLNVPSNFVNDKVVLLFLETVDVDLQSCIGKACDDSGMLRQFNLRKLLINKTDLDKVIARSCDHSSSLFPEQYDLPEIIMKRLLFSNDSRTPNTKDYFSFSQTYISAMRSTAKPATGISIYNQLFKALKQTYIDFSPILSEQYGGVNPFASLPSPAWTQYINGISAGPRYLGMQYFYDFLKDLILAYNEFRDAAFEIMSECCPDMDCFPKHLMLGEVIPTGSAKPSPYRNYFVTSPVFNNQQTKLARAISLFQRMVLMTRKMDISIFNNPPKTIVEPNTLPVPIYITPSNEKRDPLSMRSIPYYYKIHETEAGLGTLEQSWNYVYQQKALFSKGLAPLAYGNQDIVQQNDQGPVKTPLYYDTDPYDFFRIEGHMRSNYVAVKDAIKKIKKDFDLPFNVIALRLNGDSYDNIAERCNFDDLRTEYGTLRIELINLMNRLTDRFGKIGAEHRLVVKELPRFIQALIADCKIDTKQPGSIEQPQIGISTTRATAGAAASSTPVYAPVRTMSQVTSKLDTDTQNMLDLITQVISDLPFDMAQFRFGYTGKVADTTPGFIQHYFSALQAVIDMKVGFNQLLDIILRNTKTRNTPELYMDFAAYWQEVVGLLECFITDAKYRALMLLSYTFAYRVNQLKANDMTVFSNFIEKHPGIEHRAGVARGGTFILVYPGNSVAVDTVKRNFIVGEARAIKGLETQVARIKAQRVMSKEDMLIVAQHEAAILNFNTISTEIALPSVPIQKIAIEGDQVIADFTLPYLCCCDCECDEIKPPKESDQLGAPTIAPPFYAEYCLGDYAFGKDVNIGSQNYRTKELEIDIVPMLQYDKSSYSPSQVRLYLVSRSGNVLYIPYGSMQTSNSPNVPSGRTIAQVSVSKSSSGDGVNVFNYTLFDTESFTGTDSFYYIFEIVADDDSDRPAVLERSTMGKVTIDISSK